MHDIRFIREQPEVFDSALKRRNLPPMSQEILALDGERRKAQTEMQELQAKRNEASKQIGEVKRKGGDSAALMQQVAAMKDRLAQLENMDKLYARRMQEVLSSLPNMPAPDVPDGKDEHDNKELRRFGYPPLVNSAREHFELGEKLGRQADFVAGRMTVNRVAVFSSTLRFDGPVYERIGDFPLGKNVSCQ